MLNSIFLLMEETGLTGENHRSDLRQFGGFHRALGFLPPIIPTTMI
jgi:hypothetical protein